MPGWNPRLRLSAVALLVAAAFAAGQPLAAQGLREQDVTRDFGYIAMADGTQLSYVVYRPSKEGKYPIILEFSPYGIDGSQFPAAKPYLDRGYAFAGVDIRGTSCSTGTLSMFDPILADDGATVVDWLGSRPWANGVGMVGMSYPGHTQIFTASKRPKHLKAIAPGALTASGYREAWFPGGMFNHSFIGGWAFSPRDDAARRRQSWGDRECNLEHARTGNQGTYYEIKQHPLMDDDFWKGRDLENIIGKVEVPTMMEQAWQDHQTQVSAAIRLFQRVGARNKRILLQPGGHFTYRRDIAMEEVLRWMDHWLKGVDNGVEKEPPVKVFWEVTESGGKAKANWTTSYPTWPPPGAKPMTFYLTADGKLTPDKPGASKDNGAWGYTYPLGTELVGDNDQFAVRPQAGGVLSYRTTPMTEDTTIMGFSQFTFYMSSEHKDTDVLVVLHDIDQNGDTLYLTRDYLRASLRAIDPSRSTAEESVRSFAKSEPLTPGQVYEMKLSIPPLGHVLRKGHSLELAIMAPSHIGQPNWGVMILDLPGRNTVYHSAQYPSSLTLSVLPGVAAQAPAPPCGAMPFQPCRKAPRPPQQTATLR